MTGLQRWRWLRGSTARLGASVFIVGAVFAALVFAPAAGLVSPADAGTPLPTCVDTGAVQLGSTMYTQNFNGGVPGNLSNAADNTTVTIDFTPATQNFPTSWAVNEAGSSPSSTIYRTHSGGQNAGDTYSFGASGNNERALGEVSSGSSIPTFGTRFCNYDASNAITSLTITYDGEQWRDGTTTTTNTLTFEYSTNATSLTTGTWTGVSALNFATQVGTSTSGTALDGNVAPNRLDNISATITGLNIATGGTIWIRWRGADETGGDDGLAIDDFEITASRGVVNTSPTVTPSTPVAGILPVSSPGYVTVEVNETTYDNPGGTPLSFTIDDAETDTTALTLNAVSGNTAIVNSISFALGTIVGANSDPQTALLRFDAVGRGETTITLSASDGGNTTNYVINVAVSPENDVNYLTRAQSTSTGVFVGGGYALVGDDEDELLRLYNLNPTAPNRQHPRADEALTSFDVRAALGLPETNEVDIEGSALVGSTIYWMGSHSRNSSGSGERVNRERIFSTPITGGSGSTTTIATTSLPYYSHFETDLIAYDNSNGHGLGAGFYGFGTSADTAIAPESALFNGFNIEGFSQQPGSTTNFFMGFRAPLVSGTSNAADPRTHAVIVPVTGLPSIMNTSGGTAGSTTFGAPIRLDLGGRGVRSLYCGSSAADGCIILAGSPTPTQDFALYWWTGNAADAPEFRSALSGGVTDAPYNFESIVGATPGGTGLGDAATTLTLISDDGDAVWYTTAGTRNQDFGQNGQQKVRVVGATLGAGNQPIVPTCPATLNTTFGTATSANISATDPDSIVTGVSITSGAVTGITVDSVIAATADGGTLTAGLNVGTSVPQGTYNLVITFTNNESQSQPCSVTVNVGTAPGTTRIRDIQGAAHVSPLLSSVSARAAVTNVPGIVTYKVTIGTSRGFYIQDPVPDANDATSEGIFVFTSNATILGSVAVGDAVLVTGTVAEFTQTISGTQEGLPLTEIVNDSSVQTLSVQDWLCTGTCTITPTTIGTGGRVPPTENISEEADGSTVDLRTGGTFNPAGDGIDFLESLEGMSVRLAPGAEVVAPLRTFGSGSTLDSEIWVLPVTTVTGTNLRGGITLTQTDDNPERLRVTTRDGATAFANVSVGATLPETFGVIDYSFEAYEFYVPTGAPAVDQSGEVTPEVTGLSSTTPNQLTIATYNVENYSAGDDFTGRAAQVNSNLGRPDILLIQEVQDNNGTIGGTVAADSSFNAIITALGGTTPYQYLQIDPEGQNTDGGAPDGNIRVGVLYNPDVVTPVTAPLGAGGPLTAASIETASCTAGDPVLNHNPARIDPTNTAFTSSRKPLIAQFDFNGQSIFVLSVHFNSKGGDEPAYGWRQPPNLASESQRNGQATAVNAFIASLLACDPNAVIVAGGDYNDFPWSPPLNILAANLNIMNLSLAERERYGYVFAGQSQALDNILVSDAVFNNWSPVYDAVHMNAEFFDQESDHDPSIVLLTQPTTDLALSKSVDDNTLTPGQTVKFTLTLTNQSTTTAATNIEVTDTLPAGFTYVSDNAATSSTTFTSGTGVWTVPSLAANTNVSLEITMTAPTSNVASIDNVAEVTAAEQADSDSTADNAVTTEDDYDSVTVSVTDASAPTGTLIGSLTNVTTGGGTSYSFTVQYDDDAGVNTASIGGNDIDVTATIAGVPVTIDASAGTPSANGDGSYNVVYTITPPGGTWDDADSTTYTVTLIAGTVADINGLTNAQTGFGTFNVTVDAVAPAAASTPPNVTTNGQTTYTFTVTYTDEPGIDLTSIDGTEISVSNNSAPAFTLASVTVDSKTPNTGSPTSVVVQYSFTPPDNTTADVWDSSDNGSYNIVLAANKVKNTLGNFVPTATFGFSASVDSSSPTAALVGTLSNVSAGGGTTYTVTVRYDDDVAINSSTFENDDITVTRTAGGAAVSLTVTGFTPTDNGDGSFDVAYTLTPPGGAWDEADNGTYTASVVASEVADTSSATVGATTLGTFTVTIDATAPTASSTPPNVTTNGQTTYSFDVIFSDNLSVNASTFDSSDITVTGPNGFSAAASFVSSTPAGNGTPRTVTYSFTPPDNTTADTWDSSDNGTYTVSVNASQVADTEGNFVVAGQIATFNAAVDSANPTVVITAADVNAGGATSYSFGVTYSDDVDMDTSTFGDGDLVVTNTLGFSANAELQVFGTSGNGIYDAVYTFTPPGGAWDAADNDTYTVTLTNSEVADTAGKNPTGTITDTFTVNVPSADIPTADADADNVDEAGDTTYTFTVTYDDDDAIDVSTLDDDDITVTGPGGFSADANFESASPNSDDAPITATYSIVPPGGDWDEADNGAYTVLLNEDEVSDTAGNFAVDGQIDTFTVNIGDDDDDGDDDGDDDDDGGDSAAAGTPVRQIPVENFSCGNINVPTNNAIAASYAPTTVTMNGANGDVYCTALAVDGGFVADPSRIGNLEVLSQDVEQAVDVFGLMPGGVPVTQFNTPVRFCLRTNGANVAVLFLSAVGMERTLMGLPILPDSPAGYACVDVPNAGTLVLVQGGGAPAAPPAAPPAPSSAVPAGCQVTTTAQVRLRQTPDTSSDANVITTLPFNLTLTVTEAIPGWYRVVYENGQGYVSADFVNTSAECAG